MTALHIKGQESVNITHHVAGSGLDEFSKIQEKMDRIRAELADLNRDLEEKMRQLGSSRL